jgi:hypothetical protein
VKTADLAKFLAAKKIKTHVPSQREVNDIKAWAASFYEKHAQAASEEQLREQFPNISRARLRDVIKEFPAEHRRRRGG